MSSLAHKISFSAADYLAGEKTAKIRHQYIDGEIFAMAGGTKAHNQIAGNFYGLLRTHLRGTPCQVFIGDVKVHVAWDWYERYYYPDVVVGCEKGDTDPYVLEQPKLIVEVLSNSTERDDRSEKFYTYRRLPSLEEYILVAQDTLRVEVYRRETDWDLEIYTAADASLALRSIDASWVLQEVYEGLPELLAESSARSE